MIIDAEVYLEHYGVPGMKWGVRKARSERTPEEAAARSARNKKIAKTAAVVGVAAVAAVGAVYVNRQIKQANLNTKVAQLNNATARRKQAHGKIYSEVYLKGGGSPSQSFAKTKVSDLRGTRDVFKPIPMPPAPSKTKAGPLGKDMRTELRRERAMRNQEITTQLRGWYNQSNTPMKDRWYPDVNG